MKPKRLEPGMLSKLIRLSEGQAITRLTLDQAVELRRLARVAHMDRAKIFPRDGAYDVLCTDITDGSLP